MSECDWQQKSFAHIAAIAIHRLRFKQVCGVERIHAHSVWWLGKRSLSNKRKVWSIWEPKVQMFQTIRRWVWLMSHSICIQSLCIHIHHSNIVYSEPMQSKFPNQKQMIKTCHISNSNHTNYTGSRRKYDFSNKFAPKTVKLPHHTNSARNIQ